MSRIGSRYTGIHRSTRGGMPRAGVDACNHQALQQLFLLRRRQLAAKQQVQHIDVTAFARQFEDVVAVAGAALCDVGIIRRCLFAPDSCDRTGDELVVAPTDGYAFRLRLDSVGEGV